VSMVRAVNMGNVHVTEFWTPAVSLTQISTDLSKLNSAWLTVCFSTVVLGYELLAIEVFL